MPIKNEESFAPVFARKYPRKIKGTAVQNSATMIMLLRAAPENLSAASKAFMMLSFLNK